VREKVQARAYNYQENYKHHHLVRYLFSSTLSDTKRKKMQADVLEPATSTKTSHAYNNGSEKAPELTWVTACICTTCMSQKPGRS
jgi:hypothetical protein